jgi:hypothetical protein
LLQAQNAVGALWFLIHDRDPLSSAAFAGVQGRGTRRLDQPVPPGGLSMQVNDQNPILSTTGAERLTIPPIADRH